MTVAPFQVFLLGLAAVLPASAVIAWLGWRRVIERALKARERARA